MNVRPMNISKYINISVESIESRATGYQSLDQWMSKTST